MICNRCNHTYPDDMDSCPVCGEPRPDDAAQQTAWSMPASDGSPGTQQLQPAASASQAARERKTGTAPMVLGILSIMIPYVGIVLGILAIVFGNAAKKDNILGSADHSLGQTGFVLGIVGLAYQAFLVAYIAIIFGMVTSILDTVNYYNDFTPWM